MKLFKRGRFFRKRAKPQPNKPGTNPVPAVVSSPRRNRSGSVASTSSSFIIVSLPEVHNETADSPPPSTSTPSPNTSSIDSTDITTSTPETSLVSAGSIPTDEVEDVRVERQVPVDTDSDPVLAELAAQWELVLERLVDEAGHAENQNPRPAATARAGRRGFVLPSLDSLPSIPTINSLNSIPSITNLPSIPSERSLVPHPRLSGTNSGFSVFDARPRPSFFQHQAARGIPRALSLKFAPLPPRSKIPDSRFARTKGTESRWFAESDSEETFGLNIPESTWREVLRRTGSLWGETANTGEQARDGGRDGEASGVVHIEGTDVNQVEQEAVVVEHSADATTLTPSSTTSSLYYLDYPPPGRTTSGSALPQAVAEATTTETSTVQTNSQVSDLVDANLNSANEESTANISPSSTTSSIYYMDYPPPGRTTSRAALPPSAEVAITTRSSTVRDSSQVSDLVNMGPDRANEETTATIVVSPSLTRSSLYRLDPDHAEPIPATGAALPHTADEVNTLRSSMVRTRSQMTNLMHAGREWVADIEFEEDDGEESYCFPTRLVRTGSHRILIVAHDLEQELEDDNGEPADLEALDSDDVEGEGERPNRYGDKGSEEPRCWRYKGF